MKLATQPSGGTMKMRNKILAAAALCGGLLTSSNAHAAVESIVYSYVTDSPTYSTTPGGFVTVTVYLQEAESGGATSLINANGGLLGAGFSAKQSGGLPTSPAGVYHIAGSSGSFPGGTFSESGSDASDDSLATVRAESEITGAVSTGPEVADGSDANLTQTILLGTLTIEGGQSAGTTNFTVESYREATGSTAGGYTETYNTSLRYDLDKSGAPGTTADPAYVTVAGGGVGAGANTFSVSVTPEPASLSLGVLGGLGLLIRRRERKIEDIA
jgi:MYXO-CTERM domain-containing protein